MEDKKPKLVLGRPADRSLEAFKAFINGMVERLAPDVPDDVTEEKWIESHKEFWARITKKRQAANLDRALLNATFGETVESAKKIIKNKAPTW